MSVQLSLIKPDPITLDNSTLSIDAKNALVEFSVLIATQCVNKKISESMSPSEIAAVLYAGALRIKSSPKHREEMAVWPSMDEMVKVEFPWLLKPAHRSVMLDKKIFKALDVAEELLVFTGHLAPTPTEIETPAKGVSKPLSWRMIFLPVVIPFVMFFGFFLALILPSKVLSKVLPKVHEKNVVKEKK